MKTFKHLIVLVVAVLAMGATQQAEAQINYRVNNNTTCSYTCSFVVDDGFGNLTGFGLYTINPGPGATTITIPAPPSHVVVAIRIYDNCCPGGGGTDATLGPYVGMFTGQVGNCFAGTSTANWISNTDAIIF